MCCVSLVLCPELTTPSSSPPPLPLLSVLPSLTVEVSIALSFCLCFPLFRVVSVSLSSSLGLPLQARSFSGLALHFSACAFLSLFAFLPTWLFL